MSWFDENGVDNGNGFENDFPGVANAQIVPPSAPAPAPAAALPPGATMTSQGPVMLTPGYVPPPAPAVGANGSISVPRPDVNPSVVYTDQSGMGYDPGTLATKWADPAFRNDPANARVGDLLSQYAPAVSANQKSAAGGGGSSNLLAPGLMDLLGSSPLMYPWDTPMPAAMTTPFDPGPAFKAPTMADLQDPTNPAAQGYQFTLQQGIDALQRSAAAKGTLLTGGMLKGLTEYTTGLADSTYQQQYNNAYQTWAGNLGSKYQTWAGNQTQAAQNYDTTYNMFRGNQTQPFNMLMALSGAGQVAAQNLNTAGAGVGANGASTLTGIGNAQAAGQVGGANAISGNLSNIGNSAMLYGLLTGSSYNNNNTNALGTGGVH